MSALLTMYAAVYRSN